MISPKRKNSEGEAFKIKHPELIMSVFAVVGVLGLVIMGAKQIYSTTNFVSVPVEGEWLRSDRAWLLDFRPDKSLIVSPGPAATAAAPQPKPSSAEAAKDETPPIWTEGQGAYSRGAQGAVFVTLPSGQRFSIDFHAAYPNQIDLINSDTGGVAVFERMKPIKTNDQPLPRAKP